MFIKNRAKKKLKKLPSNFQKQKNRYTFAARFNKISVKTRRLDKD